MLSALLPAAPATYRVSKISLFEAMSLLAWCTQATQETQPDEDDEDVGVPWVRNSMMAASPTAQAMAAEAAAAKRVLTATVSSLLRGPECCQQHCRPLLGTEGSDQLPQSTTTYKSLPALRYPHPLLLTPRDTCTLHTAGIFGTSMMPMSCLLPSLLACLLFELLLTATLMMQVDPMQWKLEVERVAPKLRLTLAADMRDWRQHLEAAHGKSQLLAEAWPDARSALQKLATDVAASMEKVDAKERQLNNQFEGLLGQHQEVRQQLMVAQQEYNRYATKSVSVVLTARAVTALAYAANRRVIMQCTS